MGARRQIFVVAKVASRCRGLVALHHQVLNSAKAVSCCRRLLQLFRARENRVPIEQELFGAQSRNEAFRTRSWACDLAILRTLTMLLPRTRMLVAILTLIILTETVQTEAI